MTLAAAMSPDLAEKYREWAEALQVSHPFVASNLLMGPANAYDQ